MARKKHPLALVSHQADDLLLTLEVLRIWNDFSREELATASGCNVDTLRFWTVKPRNRPPHLLLNRLLAPFGYHLVIRSKDQPVNPPELRLPPRGDIATRITLKIIEKYNDHRLYKSR